MPIPEVQRTNQSVELGQLLANTIASVVQAQEQLDAYTQRRQAEYAAAPQGSQALPPLWYLFSNVAVEMELSASIAQITDANDGEPKTHIVSRMLDPTSVGLYGYQASAGLRVRVQMEPQGFVPIKQTSEDATRSPSPPEES